MTGVQTCALPIYRVGRTAGDTCHLDVVDRWGTMVSATPSGGWLQSNPVVPELGFPLGTRLQMTWLDEGLPKTLTPPTASREYRLVVTNGIAAPLVVAAQPQSVQVATGASSSLRIAMGAGGPYTYQWYRDGAVVSGGTAEIGRAHV